MTGTEYRTFRSQNAIVVTRFDRLAHRSGAVERRHQEDMSQALGTDAKYEEYRGPSAADITRLLREASPTSAAARANVSRFLDGLIYNTVIGAPDAHARNYAVLLDGEDVTVAPCTTSRRASHTTGPGRAGSRPCGSAASSRSRGWTPPRGAAWRGGPRGS